MTELKVGDRQKKLTIAEIITTPGKYATKVDYRCDCDCGGTRTLKGHEFRRGKITSCSKCLGYKDTKKGDRFGIWTLGDPAGRGRYHATCDCGTEAIRCRWDLLTGKSLSCGCRMVPDPDRCCARCGGPLRMMKSGRAKCPACVGRYRKRWMQEHPEARIAKRKRHTDKYKTTIRGRLVFLRHQAKNRVKVYTQGKYPTETLFNITTDYLEGLWNAAGGRCALSGLPMSLEQRDLKSVSLDRIDSGLGYVEGNVQLLCKWVNLAKNSHTNEEVRAVLGELANLNYPSRSEHN